MTCTNFRPESWCSLNKNKKKSLLEISPIFHTFRPKIEVFSKKIQKKGLHLKSLSDFTLFILKSQCSLKKRFLVVIRPRFLIFSQKLDLLSKKKKVFASDWPYVSLILFQNRAVFYSVEKYRSLRTNSLVMQSMTYMP